MKNLSMAMAVTLLTTLAFAQNKTDSKKSSYEPLLWEVPMTNKKGQMIESKDAYYARLKRSSKWTLKVYEILRTEARGLVESNPTDADFYCPNYTKLTKDQKVNFWGQLVSAIAFKESSWKPASRTKESVRDFPKADVVTKEPVYSEGLMMLSYQDERSYENKFNCQFDWEKDKRLKRDDPDKSILAPYRNLRCGILILNNQVKNNNKITTRGGYWSVIRPRAVNKYSATLWIAKQTQKLTFCGKSSVVQNAK